MADRLMKRRRKLSRKISDEFSINSLDARQANRKQSSTTSKPKRIYIFEGGFKSNEDYVYIRGKGKGKYVSLEASLQLKIFWSDRTVFNLGLCRMRDSLQKAVDAAEAYPDTYRSQALQLLALQLRI